MLRAALLAALILLALPPASSATARGQRSAGVPLTSLRVQLKWATQAQFAGYYAAQALGYFSSEGLNVTLLEGGPEVTPEDVVAGGEADIGVD
jgi:NitT/TauT family transport system substrate-binding protein